MCGTNKRLSIIVLYTSMNKMNSFDHMKEHPKISNFLQFVSQLAVNVSKLKLISDLKKSKYNVETVQKY